MVRHCPLPELSARRCGPGLPRAPRLAFDGARALPHQCARDECTDASCIALTIAAAAGLPEPQPGHPSTLQRGPQRLQLLHPSERLVVQTAARPPGHGLRGPTVAGQPGASEGRQTAAGHSLRHEAGSVRRRDDPVYSESLRCMLSSRPMREMPGQRLSSWMKALRMAAVSGRIVPREASTAPGLHVAPHGRIVRSEPLQARGSASSSRSRRREPPL